ncbi:hypothetical protein OS493_026371 [Desmophyllum pertusum]|uniref:Uncharacterized protein n=1 Tax=Desmophyllum pertusum TaxID=174260 RepID=A0A9X0CY76_9CNID|nr:hypothetical protein OS493_026371 [Desmophyllum pertusum]
MLQATNAEDSGRRPGRSENARRRRKDTQKHTDDASFALKNINICKNGTLYRLPLGRPESVTVIFLRYSTTPILMWK